MREVTVLIISCYTIITTLKCCRSMC